MSASELIAAIFAANAPACAACAVGLGTRGFPASIARPALLTGLHPSIHPKPLNAPLGLGKALNP